jgi:hypothetical protein
VQESELIRECHGVSPPPGKPPFEVACSPGNRGDKGRSGYWVRRQAIRGCLPLQAVLACRPVLRSTTQEFNVFAKHKASREEAEAVVELAAISDSEKEHGTGTVYECGYAGAQPFSDDEDKESKARGCRLDTVAYPISVGGSQMVGSCRTDGTGLRTSSPRANCT